jgi:hypothetical protein
LAGVQQAAPCALGDRRSVSVMVEGSGPQSGEEE